MKRITIAILIPMALTACSGGSADTADPKTPATSSVSSASTTPSPAAQSTTTSATPATPTTSATSATNQQYASIVAEEELGIDKILRDVLDTRHCDWTGFGPLDVRPGYLTCGIQIFTLGLKAQTLAINLESAQRRIGPPPAEIASLVKDTIGVALDVKKAAQKADPCSLEQGPGCGEKLRNYYTAMTSLRDQLAAWGPYQ